MEKLTNLEHLESALRQNRYEVCSFETKEEAADYLTSLFNGAVIGFGDSVTLREMGLNEKLSERNTVFDPNTTNDNDEFLAVAKKCLTTEYFITSVNAVTEDGVLINIDGTGNRVAGSLFGHKKVYYVIGRNKIAPDIEKAVWRVRNIAAPQNAKRLKLRTPCAIRGDKCYNCKSPDRICNGLLIQWKKMNDIEAEVVLINEELGY